MQGSWLARADGSTEEERRRGDAAIEFVRAIGRILGYVEDVSSLRGTVVDPVRFRQGFVRAVRLEVALQASQAEADWRAVFGQLLSELESGVAAGQKVREDMRRPLEPDQ